MTEEEEKVALDKLKAEIWAKQDVEDLRAIASTSAGRRHLWKLLTLCGVYGSSFRGEDTHAMAFAEGKRHIGLSVVESLFTADAEAYTVMRNEAASRLREMEKLA